MMARATTMTVLLILAIFCPLTSIIHGEWSESVIMDPRLFWDGDAFAGPADTIYYVCAGDGLDLGTKTGDTWQFETISLTAEAAFSSYDSIPLQGTCDSSGNIHFICPLYSSALEEWRLVHWIRTTDGWESHDIGAQTYFLGPVARNGQLYMGVLEDGIVHFKTWTDGTWQTLCQLTLGDDPDNISFDVSPGGTIHVAYRTDYLNHSFWNGTDWDTVILWGSEYYWVMDTTIHAVTDVDVHIFAVTQGVRHFYLDSGIWHEEIISEFSGTFQEPLISARDAEGTFYVQVSSYREPQAALLMVGSTGNWKSIPVPFEYDGYDIVIDETDQTPYFYSIWGSHYNGMAIQESWYRQSEWDSRTIRSVPAYRLAGPVWVNPAGTLYAFLDHRLYDEANSLALLYGQPGDWHITKAPVESKTLHDTAFSASGYPAGLSEDEDTGFTFFYWDGTDWITQSPWSEYPGSDYSWMDEIGLGFLGDEPHILMAPGDGEDLLLDFYSSSGVWQPGLTKNLYDPVYSMAVTGSGDSLLAVMQSDVLEAHITAYEARYENGVLKWDIDSLGQPFYSANLYPIDIPGDSHHIAYQLAENQYSDPFPELLSGRYSFSMEPIDGNCLQPLGWGSVMDGTPWLIWTGHQMDEYRRVVVSTGELEANGYSWRWLNFPLNRAWEQSEYAFDEENIRAARGPDGGIHFLYAPDDDLRLSHIKWSPPPTPSLTLWARHVFPTGYGFRNINSVQVQARVRNDAEARNANLYAALEYPMGYYYFWPAWSSDPADADAIPLQLGANETIDQELLGFYIPYGFPTREEVWIHAALTSPAGELQGDLSSIFFMAVPEF